MTISVTVLGATGSIGRSTADLLGQHPGRFRAEAVVGGRDAAALAATARALNARFAALADPAGARALAEALAGSGIAHGAGAAAVIEAATREADVVVAAISGAAGLRPTHAALRLGRTVALANKESLVCAGDAFMRDAARYGARVLPMDSEHNALQQALGTGRAADVVRMILTASGGPFRETPREEIARAPATKAAAHPTWSMGLKINIDSATLMNKGLELIEAHHLFALPAERLDVVVHPQSIVHGLVEWRDGMVTAGLAVPDMRVPIADCLALGGQVAGRNHVPGRHQVQGGDAPAERLTIAGGRRLDLAAIGRLTFEAPDEARFPCLRIARAALAAGGAQPTVMNAANEVAVAAYIAGRIGFYGVAELVERTCERLAARYPGPPDDVDAALAIDQDARAHAEEVLAGGSLAEAGLAATTAG